MSPLATPGASWRLTVRRALPPSLTATGAAGQPTPHPNAVMTDVVHLAKTRYEGVNHTHLSELLSERDGIDIGPTTLRRILLDAGLTSPRRRCPPKHRVRRQRMPREGMLIQMDGSHHPWLGDQAPSFAVLIAVDDATGAVVDALFCEQEDSRNYFVLIQGLVQRCGIPVALYNVAGCQGTVATQRGRWRPAVAMLGEIVRVACSKRRSGTSLARVCEAVG